MKRFLTIFVIIFALVFILLNYRYILANFKFWIGRSTGSQAYEDKKPQPALLPISQNKNGSDFQGSLVLQIPSLNIEAPVIREPSLNLDTIFGRLEDGVVLYGGTAVPGENGVSIILCHSSAYPWYKGDYGSVFALLGKLKTGDKIYINKNGRLLVYKVSESLIFHPFESDDKAAQLEKTGNSSIILVSCWPVNTNWKRIAVKADLI